MFRDQRDIGTADHDFLASGAKLTGQLHRAADLHVERGEADNIRIRLQIDPFDVFIDDSDAKTRRGQGGDRRQP